LADFGYLLAFQTGLTAGQSLISGADEVLFYEKLKFNRNSVNWRRLMMRAGQVSLVALLSANVIGGFIFGFNPELTWILNGTAFIVAMLTIWNIKDEPREKQKSTNLS
jgi:hypothetical protein